MLTTCPVEYTPENLKDALCICNELSEDPVLNS